jgi:V/A-type H+-transporting ATPase subunit E
MSDDKLPAHGVQDLIERLRSEAVEGGRAEANRLVAEAQTRAEQILAEAQAEAERVLEEARKTQAKLESATREALALAVRDAKLKLRQELMAAFDRKLAELVRQALKPAPFLEQVILQIAGELGRNLSQGSVTIWLPSGENASATLAQLALGVTKEMLSEGLEIKIGAGFAAGIRIELGEEVMIDLSDQALTCFLSAHLRPKFRLLLEGIYAAG